MACDISIRKDRCFMRKTAMGIVVILLILGGCKNKNSAYWDSESLIKYWDSESIKETHGKTMAAMLWLRQTTKEGNINFQYQVYKRFDGNDYKLLLQYLKNPERPSLVHGEAWTEWLYISFLDGTRYVIGFNIRDKTIILPNGYSKKLYSLLTEKEPCPAYDPKKDPIGPEDPNVFMQTMRQ
jgi:hypothetical protein